LSFNFNCFVTQYCHQKGNLHCAVWVLVPVVSCHFVYLDMCKVSNSFLTPNCLYFALYGVCWVLSSYL